MIGPIEQALKRVRQNDAFAGVFASVTWTGLDWTPGKSYCALLVLTDPSPRSATRSAIRRAAGQQPPRQGAQPLTRDGDYAVLPSIRDVTEVAVAEVLSHDEIAFEVDQVDLDQARGSPPPGSAGDLAKSSGRTW